MDSFVALASDSKRQTEARRNSTHRLYDIIQVTDHPEAVISQDACFEERDIRSHESLEPIHMSIESHEREHLWSKPPANNNGASGSLTSSLYEAAQSLVEKIGNLSMQHKQAQKEIIVPSERIPVANDVIKAQSHTVTEAASQSSPLGVPREKIIIHLDQAKDLSAIGQRSEFSKTADVVTSTISKPLQVIGNVVHKPVERINTQPLVSTTKVDLTELDREIEATVV